MFDFNLGAQLEKNSLAFGHLTTNMQQMEVHLIHALLNIY